VSAVAPAFDDSDGRDDASAYGLYTTRRFDVVEKPVSWPGVVQQALWYFRDETVALPWQGQPVAGYTRGVATYDDVRAWARALSDAPPADLPPLVWVAAPDAVHGARVSPDGTAVECGGRRFALELAPRHPLNRSWLDASSFAYFAQCPVSLRGRIDGHRFAARTFWPDDFAFRALSAPIEWAIDDAGLGIRALMREREDGGARAPFSACTLWRRADAAEDCAGKPVLAFIVNGAQGDDDEAHAGHFAIATGRARRDGRLGEWLVNNFYALDIESEKGILAAPVPLDNYQGDVNAGQSWYRPSHVLVAVLDDPRAALLVQSALGRVYNQFWRHQLAYYHPRVNCTSISVDTLAALGWRIRSRGPTSRAAAWLGLPWLMARERSVREGLRASDYLSADATRLLPAAAFEAVGASLVALVRRTEEPRGLLARWLARDVSALALLRLPQFPSSRAFGDAPVVSLSEYAKRLPARRSDYRIVPVPPRPLPDSLRDADILPPPIPASKVALGGWMAASAIAAAGALVALLR
jgi:hypothetical protein